MTARSLGRSAVVAFVGCLALWFAALGVDRLPLPGSAKETLTEMILAPVLVVARLVSFLFDSFGPSGLPEPASQYATDWAISLMMVLTFAFVFPGFMALAVLSEKTGWRVGVGIPLAVVGMSSAARAFTSPIYPESAGSPDTWMGSLVVIAGLYLILDGAARRLSTWPGLRLASRVALGATLLAGSWLGYLVWV